MSASDFAPTSGQNRATPAGAQERRSSDPVCGSHSRQAALSRVRRRHVCRDGAARLKVEIDRRRLVELADHDRAPRILPAALPAGDETVLAAGLLAVAGAGFAELESIGLVFIAFAEAKEAGAAGAGCLLSAVAAIDTDLKRLAKASGACRRLMTIPGVGHLTALAFTAAVDDPQRFRRSRDIGAYLGLVPRRYQSGEVLHW